MNSVVNGRGAAPGNTSADGISPTPCPSVCAATVPISSTARRASRATCLSVTLHAQPRWSSLGSASHVAGVFGSPRLHRAPGSETRSTAADQGRPASAPSSLDLARVSRVPEDDGRDTWSRETGPKPQNERDPPGKSLWLLFSRAREWGTGTCLETGGFGDV